MNELLEIAKETEDLEGGIIQKLYSFGDIRLSQLSFAIGLFVPWAKYILDPEEANPEFPHCVPREDAPGQPWDIAGGDVVQPEPSEVLNAMRVWLKMIYDDIKTSVGHTPLPNYYNVTYGGEVVINYGSIWLLSDKNAEGKIMEIATDTKVSRVLHKAMKAGISAPPLDELYAVFSREYESAEHRARELAKFLELKEPRAERKTSVTEMMRDAVTGDGGELHLTEDGFEWKIFDDEDIEFVMSKLGVTNANAGRRPADEPEWKTIIRQIDSKASAGKFKEAKELTLKLADNLPGETQ